VGLDVCCPKKAKNQQSSFFVGRHVVQGKILFFLEEASQNRALKMRSAQRYTARGKRNTQKLKKQSGFVRH
jgi:hypothetical protein